MNSPPPPRSVGCALDCQASHSIPINNPGVLVALAAPPVIRLLVWDSYVDSSRVGIWQRGEFLRLRSLNYSAILFESFPAETILKILLPSFSSPKVISWSKGALVVGDEEN